MKDQVKGNYENSQNSKCPTKVIILLIISKKSVVFDFSNDEPVIRDV